jgi:hypothetical protein
MTYDFENKKAITFLIKDQIKKAGHLSDVSRHML